MVENQRHPPAEQVRKDLLVVVGDVNEIEPRQCDERRAGEMRRGSAAGRAVTEAPRFRLGEPNQLVDAARRQRRMHGHDQRLAPDARDRRKIGDGIIGKVLVEADVDRVGLARAQHQRVAVGLRPSGGRGAERAAGSRLVLDDQPLAQRFRELLGELAADEIGAGPSRVRNDEPDRPRRIVLRDGGHARQARGQQSGRNQSEASSMHRAVHFIVGMMNSAPSLVPEGQRDVTVLVLV
jgi:hypothetical protein